MKETVEQKACRLVEEGRITPIPVKGFAVEGDTGTYLVTQLSFERGGFWNCTCPAEVECTHIKAARQISS